MLCSLLWDCWVGVWGSSRCSVQEVLPRCLVHRVVCHLLHEGLQESWCRGFPKNLGAQRGLLCRGSPRHLVQGGLPEDFMYETLKMLGASGSPRCLGKGSLQDTWCMRVSNTPKAWGLKMIDAQGPPKTLG